MARGLKRQFFYAIQEGQAFGQSKRADRAGGDDLRSKVYSYSTRDALRDVSKNFSDWMMQSHPEVRQVREITQEHAREFLEAKAAAGCSRSTIETYKSHIDKLSTLSNEAYGLTTDFGNVEMPAAQVDVLRDIRVKATDWEQIKAAAVPCASELGVSVCEAFGLRTSESVKIRREDIGENSLHIHKAKGGRSRDIEIKTDKQREVLERLKDFAEANERGDSDKILNITADAQNAWLRRQFSHHNMNEYIEAKTGVHGLRKGYATDRYVKEFRERNGREPERRDGGYEYDRNTWNPICKDLGHGQDRTDLFHRYIVA